MISFANPLPDRFLIELTGVPFGPNAGKKLETVVGSVKKQIDMPGPFTAQIPIELNGEKVSTQQNSPARSEPPLPGLATNRLREKQGGSQPQN